MSDFASKSPVVDDNSQSQFFGCHAIDEGHGQLSSLVPSYNRKDIEYGSHGIIELSILLQSSLFVCLPG